MRTSGLFAILPTAWLVVAVGCQLESGGVGDTGSTGTSTDDSATPSSGPGSSPSSGPQTGDTTEDPPTTTETTGPAGDWPDTPYQWRKPILIHAGADLEDFPVAILLSEDADLAEAAADDGSDLAVMAGDGTSPLPYEVEQYVDDGTLTLWVDAGSLSADEPTRIYLYYGLEDPPAPPPASDTWPSRFIGVWHMRVDGTDLPDSAQDPHDAVAPNPPSSASSQPGIAGPAADFDGVDDLHAAGDPMEGSLDIGTDPFTVSFWVQMTTTVGSFDTPLYKGASSSIDPGYGFYFRTEAMAPNWVGCIADNVAPAQHMAYGPTRQLIGPEWHHVVMTVHRDDDMLRGYLDGALVQEQPLMADEAIDSGNQLVFSDANNPFRGRLDEVRLQRAAVDEARVLAEWTNLDDPSSFFTVEPAEAHP